MHRHVFALAIAILLAARPALANEVLVGTNQCEGNQTVHVSHENNRFYLQWGNQKLEVVAELTSTGTVRLENKQHGVLWLQIPQKSMLLNTKTGRRLIDTCLHPLQKRVHSTPQLLR
jgi:hypothetical protein